MPFPVSGPFTVDDFEQVYGALFALKLSVAYAVTPVVLEWRMPDQPWAFAFYLDFFARGFAARTGADATAPARSRPRHESPS